MQVWYKRFIPIFLFLLVLLPISLAVKPTQISDTIRGFIIEMPQVEYIKQGQEGVTLHTHVFNTTNGFPMIPSRDNLECRMDLYNNTGKHTYKGLMIADSTDREWKLDIGEGNFSLLGMHSFIIWCNDSTSGGFVRGGFEITETGKAEALNNNEDEYFLYFIFIVAIILLGISFLKNDHNLASISGMLLFVLGGYIIAQGFSTLTNSLSVALGIILIGVGFYILLRSNIENF